MTLAVTPVPINAQIILTSDEMEGIVKTFDDFMIKFKLNQTEARILYDTLREKVTAAIPGFVHNPYSYFGKSNSHPGISSYLEHLHTIINTNYPSIYRSEKVVEFMKLAMETTNGKLMIDANEVFFVKQILKATKELLKPPLNEVEVTANIDAMIADALPKPPPPKAVITEKATQVPGTYIFGKKIW